MWCTVLLLAWCVLQSLQSWRLHRAVLLLLMMLHAHGRQMLVLKTHWGSLFHPHTHWAITRVTRFTFTDSGELGATQEDHARPPETLSSLTHNVACNMPHSSPKRGPWGGANDAFPFHDREQRLYGGRKQRQQNPLAQQSLSLAFSLSPVITATPTNTHWHAEAFCTTLHNPLC